MHVMLKIHCMSALLDYRFMIIYNIMLANHKLPRSLYVPVAICVSVQCMTNELPGRLNVVIAVVMRTGRRFMQAKLCDYMELCVQALQPIN